MITILIKYSELTLKGKNRNQFINWLIDNIKYRLDKNNINYEIIKKYDHAILNAKNLKSEDEIYQILQNIPGIHSFAPIYIQKITIENIISDLEKIIANIRTNFKFRITIKNSGFAKKIFSSNQDAIIFIAKEIFKINNNLKVDLKNFDYNFEFNFTAENKYHLNVIKYNGIIGLPSGINGEGLSMLSGGIDSPVASYLTICRGINLSFISFLTSTTSTKETLTKIKLLAEKINQFNGKDHFLYLINFEKMQEAIAKLKGTEYRTILLRRAFFKFANILAEKENKKLIVTGDSLGQVSSQTLESLIVINKAVDLFTMRPLIALSKEEIINKAKKIETYQLSILKGEDMCSLFTPKNPKTKPTLEKTIYFENQIENYPKILEEIFERYTRKIKLG
ncbi:/ thiI / putative tRNA sulfurtransferase /:474639 Reverse [Candidatus Hepatoplasma crinochetorum]|uniref:Probable tRNA sulfurtransferase n=1 Tax=Candidatus Hepatoplasma crinochetorum TaxID=295596 RepID=A0A0G7ZLC9_9MOLU|nr:/ thiI / putative tRNA sulfurtransferase /:474639 Reverse [Candidatus Hepatoplasma crinochetorum]